MTKLFYTCPIEAAYMSKKFSVKFTDEDGDEIFLHNNIAQGIWMWRWRDEPSGYYGGFPKKLPDGKIVEDIKYWVAPESEKIFEPKEVDVAWWKFGNGNALGTTTPLLIKQGGCSEIITRDNKHFFMPQREE